MLGKGFRFRHEDVVATVAFLLLVVSFRGFLVTSLGFFFKKSNL